MGKEREALCINMFVKSSRDPSLQSSIFTSKHKTVYRFVRKIRLHFELLKHGIKQERLHKSYIVYVHKYLKKLVLYEYQKEKEKIKFLRRKFQEKQNRFCPLLSSLSLSLSE